MLMRAARRRLHSSDSKGHPAKKRRRCARQGPRFQQRVGSRAWRWPSPKRFSICRRSSLCSSAARPFSRPSSRPCAMPFRIAGPSRSFSIRSIINGIFCISSFTVCANRLSPASTTSCCAPRAARFPATPGYCPRCHESLLMIPQPRQDRNHIVAEVLARKQRFTIQPTDVDEPVPSKEISVLVHQPGRHIHRSLAPVEDGLPREFAGQALSSQFVFAHAQIDLSVVLALYFDSPWPPPRTSR